MLHFALNFSFFMTCHTATMFSLLQRFAWTQKSFSHYAKFSSIGSFRTRNIFLCDVSSFHLLGISHRTKFSFSTKDHINLKISSSRQRKLQKNSSKYLHLLYRILESFLRCDISQGNIFFPITYCKNRWISLTQ
jgi:hypothetical protein